MSLEIKIKAPNAATYLVGRDYAKEVYKTEVKPVLKGLVDESRITLVYPDNIIGVSISFTQEMNRLLTTGVFRKRFNSVTFKSSSEELDNKIRLDVNF